MNKDKLKKILSKVASFEKNAIVSIAKEFTELDEKIDIIKDKIEQTPKQDNSDVVKAVKEIEFKQDNSRVEELLQKIADKPEKEIIVPKPEKIIFPKFPKFPEFPSVIEVKEPKWYEKFNYDTIIKSIKGLAEKTFKITSEDTLKVNILDSKGKVVDEFSGGKNNAHPGGYFSGWIKNIAGTLINPAQEDGNLADIKTNTDKIPTSPATENGNLATLAGKDFATQTTLALIKAKTDNLDIAQSALNFPAGSGSNGTVTLTLATTAYSVPATASTKNHILVVYNGSDTDMFWGYATLTTGGMLLASGATMSVDLGANQTIFAYCASAGKVLNYSYKEIS